MPDDIAVSVAIPTYNRAKYLPEALDAILNQTYPVAEIVVVDDGSTDETPRVLDQYKDNVKSLRIKNSGPANARRIAVELGSCPWVSFCDSDDLWLPNHIETHVNLLRKHPQVNFTFSDLIPFGPNAIPSQTYFSDAPPGWWSQFGSPDGDNVLLLGEDAYEPFLVFNPASPVTTLMTRELYESIGGIDSVYTRTTAGDADMARRSVLQGNAACCLSATAKQRRHDGNISGEIVKTILGKITILEGHIKDGVAPSHLVEAVRAEISRARVQAFYAAFYASDYEALRRIYADIPATVRTYDMAMRVFYLKARSLLGT